MFTGIIKAVSPVLRAERQSGMLVLTVKTPRGWRVRPGDSIATDGACLTVKSAGRGCWTAELMPETLAKTTFGKAVPRRVNLEPPLKLGDALGGHFVTGHVDAIGAIARRERRGKSATYTIRHPAAFSRLVAPKGSVAVEGVSLTVVRAERGFLTVSLVPYTLSHTTLGAKRAGATVNIEFDILAKYGAAKRKSYL